MAEETDLTGALGKLLSDPEVLSKAMKIASSLRDSGALSEALSDAPAAPAAGTEGGGTAEETRSDARGAPPFRAPGGAGGEYGRISPGSVEDAPPARRDGPLTEARRESADGLPRADARSGAQEKRRQLLSALRPYLSRERQEMIDAALKILRLLELAESLGGIGKLL